MTLHRSRFARVLVASAVAMAAALPLLAAPAGAVVTTACTGGQYPSRFLAQAGFKVACTTAAADNTNHVDIHDSDNAIWHHGAARAVSLGSGTTAATAATAANSPTIHFTGSVISVADVRRPISAFDATTKAAVFKAGTFIKSVGPTSTCTTTCTSAVLSQPASLTKQTLSAKVEHTTNRFLVDATCTSGVATLTTTAPGFLLSDVGKSVSGGPFNAGTYVSSVTANGALSATLNQAPPAACTTNNGGDATASPPVAPAAGADKIQLGAAYYGNPPTPTPVWNPADAMSIQLSNTTGGGQGFTCSSSTLAMTAASKADTGGFVASDVKLRVLIKGSAATVYTRTITNVTLTGNTSVTLSGTPSPICPAGISATVGFAAIGVADASAPANGDAVMTLDAELNLNPALVPIQDDCTKGTLEGITIVGGWVNPGAYSANTSTPKVSVGQIVFQTAVLAFNGFVVPKSGGETNGAYSDANPHYTFTFPVLPTSLAACIDHNGTSSLTDDHPLSPTGLTFGVNATTSLKAPIMPIGSGNLADPNVRILMPETGSFSQTYQQINNTGPTVLSTDATACTVVGATADPSFGCGDG